MVEEAELIHKVEEWRKKANSETDAFDRYVSIFIGYNIFYNLYEKKKKNDLNVDFLSGDSRRAIAVLELSNSAQLFDEISADLNKYLRIIPMFNEEYWPDGKRGSRGLPIAETLKTAFQNRDKKKTIELLAKWLYKVRCNLVHGVKSYEDANQRELLQRSAILLDEILVHLLVRYNST